MFKVTYKETTEEIETYEAVMTLMNKINDNKLVNHQLVIIETTDQGVMEIALGMGDESVIFYIPDSEEEEIKVSCNELVDRAKSEAIELTHPLDEEVDCTVSNIVALEKAFITLEAFLQNKDFMGFVDWYVY